MHKPPNSFRIDKNWLKVSPNYLSTFKMTNQNAIKSNSSASQFVTFISMDHCYAKPWSAHPDASNAKPAHYIFMNSPQRQTLKSESDEIIDIESVEPPQPLPYDSVKALSLMDECSKHVNFARLEEVSDDWEENVNRAGWTIQQNRLFNKVMKVLQLDRLARLTTENAHGEPIVRRNIIDKSAKRIRHILASFSWETKLVQWLHSVLLESLDQGSLSSYLDILQTLRSKIPVLIDRLIAISIAPKSASAEALSLLLKRTWDPVSSTIAQNKPKKLPGNPIFLIAPNGPTSPNATPIRRYKLWNQQLSYLGKIVPVTMHTVSGGMGVSISQCLEHMIGAVRTKVIELKTNFPSRPIILIGWNVGSLVASHVALMESVSAVVCLGLPFNGLMGRRGTVDDPLLESRTPTLFIVGQLSSTCNIDDIEDMRERMRAETRLLVVGGADHQLRMLQRVKRRSTLTQSLVDRSIQNEIAEFVGGILEKTTLSSSETVETESTNSQKRPCKRKVPRDTLSSIKKKNPGLGKSSTAKSNSKKSSLSQSLPATPVSSPNVTNQNFLTGSFNSHLSNKNFSVNLKNQKSTDKKTELHLNQLSLGPIPRVNLNKLPSCATLGSTVTLSPSLAQTTNNLANRLCSQTQSNNDTLTSNSMLDNHTSLSSHNTITTNLHLNLTNATPANLNTSNHSVCESGSSTFASTPSCTTPTSKTSDSSTPADQGKEIKVFSDLPPVLIKTYSKQSTSIQDSIEKSIQRSSFFDKISEVSIGGISSLPGVASTTSSNLIVSTDSSQSSKEHTFSHISRITNLSNQSNVTSTQSSNIVVYTQSPNTVLSTQTSIAETVKHETKST